MKPTRIAKRPRPKHRRDRDSSPLVPTNYETAKALYNTPAYKEWREYVLHRDSYICQMCGKGGQLEVHHIKPKLLFPELTLDPHNGITLCKSCHQTIVTRKEDKFAFIFSRIVRLNTRQTNA